MGRGEDDVVAEFQFAAVRIGFSALRSFRDGGVTWHVNSTVGTSAENFAPNFQGIGEDCTACVLLWLTAGRYCCTRPDTSLLLLSSHERRWIHHLRW